MKTIYSTVTITKLDSRGNVRHWIGHVVETEGVYYTRQEYWQVKNDGTDSIHQFSEPVRVLPKNVGRSNETTPYEQAIAEITSLYNEKIDEGYSDDTTATPIFLPMLAHKFEVKRAKFPAFVQPKLDGIRATRNPDGTFWTRKGKQIIPEVVEHLNNFNVDIVVDGELILPPEYSFQETVSAVKKVGEHSNKLLYYIYDCYIPTEETAVFEKRYHWLRVINSWINEDYNKINVILTETKYCESLEQFELYAALFIQQGYEGAMYRSKNGVYKVNARSYDLLKYKEFVDEEFTIVAVTDGVGREEGCAIFTCVTAAGKQFNVRPKVTIEERRTMFSNSEQYIGKKYTVRFQEYTDDEIPRFPVGIGIRDYE